MARGQKRFEHFYSLCAGNNEHQTTYYFNES